MEGSANFGISSASSVQHKAKTAILYIWSAMLGKSQPLSAVMGVNQGATYFEPFRVGDLSALVIASDEARNHSHLLVYPPRALLSLPIPAVEPT